jgi:ankyrin repeat protein
VNAAAKDGLTPLHKAAATGLVEVIKLLLSHDADASRVTQLGDTPLALASKNNQDEAVALLTGVI